MHQSAGGQATIRRNHSGIQETGGNLAQFCAGRGVKHLQVVVAIVIVGDDVAVRQEYNTVEDEGITVLADAYKLALTHEIDEENPQARKTIVLTGANLEALVRFLNDTDIPVQIIV